MRIYSISILFIAAMLLSGCSSNNNNDNVADIAGTWRASVSITSCSPIDVCADIGFASGLSVNATLVITQNRSELNGTYAYDNTPIAVPVSGRVGDAAVSLAGVASQSIGSVTVNLSGNVSGNTMTIAVTHQVTLNDNRSANIVGSGTFTR